MALFRKVDHMVWPETEGGARVLPVNVFDGDHDVIVTAPMPGIAPEQIAVDVAGRQLAISAGQRGPGQERRHYFRREWAYGPYLRRIELPCLVDAEHANASFGNGVLTVTLPKAQRASTRRVELRATGTAEGHLRGHTGHRSMT